MTDRIQAHAFIAGELDEPFYGRSDLEKYDLGLALAENFFIDYRGGIKSRPGLVFCDGCADQARVMNFRTGAATNDIVLVLSESRLRFMDGGRYLVEAAKTVVSSAGTTVVCTAHGYSNNDFVVIAGASCPNGTYKIAVIDSNSFSLQFPWGAGVPSTSGSGGSVSRVLTLSIPYSASEIQSLKMSQKYLTATFTHVNHPPQELILNPASGAWTFAPATFSAGLPTPSVVTVAGSASGSARAIYAVASVDGEGNESIAKRAYLINSVNFTATAGSALFSWSAVTNAVFYRIYRSIVTENPSLTSAQPLGLIGEIAGTSIIDNNIVPDFSVSPPLNSNPFASGAVLKLEVTAGGTGYTDASVVTIAGGVGFVGYPVVISGNIAAINILESGSGYTTASVVSISGGTGATAVVTQTSPASGNNPAVSTTFQQRRVYAGTTNLPMTVFASKPGVDGSFASSSEPNEGDAYILTIDAPTVVPIKHLVSLRDGLLVLHEEGIDRITASTGKAVTATNNYLENQIRSRISNAEPALVDNDLIFSLDDGGGVRALAYTIYTESFAPQNVSVLSAHLFGPGRSPRRLVWAEEPHRVLWVVRADGRFLSLTYLREQEIRGWAQHWTQGLVRDMCSVTEGTKTVLYATINRNGRWFVERLADREISNVEDAVCVDAALTYTGDRKTAILTIAETGDFATLTAGAASFGSDVGRIVRAGGGKYKITEVASSTVATALIQRPATLVIPGTSTNLPVGSWTISTELTTLQGLWHLEGETVSILGDGDVHDSAVVTGGAVPITKPASRFSVGLPFVANAKTLPLSSPRLESDGRKKRVVGTAIRVNETRGLEVGPDGGTLYEMKDKGDEYLDDPIPLRYDSSFVFVGSRWELDSALVFRQAYPLPAYILGLVSEVELDDI